MPSQAAYRSVQNAQSTQGSSRLSCMSHAYNPHAVGSKLGREPPPAALARRWEESRCSGASAYSKHADAAHAHSKQPVNGLQRAEVMPMKPLADELEQPPFANQPAVRRLALYAVETCQLQLFSSSQEVGSSSKRRLPEVKLCIVAAGSSSLRSTWSTFTGSTCRRTGFTRSVRRRYLLCSNASTRFASDQSGVTETVCVRDPVQTS